MKKMFLGIGLASGLAFSILAAPLSQTVTCAVNSVTNVPTALGGGLTLLSVQVSTPVNNSANIQLFDTAYTGLGWTNAAYSTVGTYVTNYINTWTNFYGATNSVTNKALIDYSNYVAAANGALTPDYAWVLPTNQTVQFNNLNNKFSNGLVITNSAGGTATIVITYTQ